MNVGSVGDTRLTDAPETPVVVVSASFVANPNATVVRSAVTAGTTPVSKPEPTMLIRAVPALVVAAEIEPAPVVLLTVIERGVPAV